jgi:hypothetical protein
VPAELVPHRGQDFVGEVVFAARAKSLVERRAQHGYRNRFIEDGGDGPDNPGKYELPPSMMRSLDAPFSLWKHLPNCLRTFMTVVLQMPGLTTIVV